MIEGDAETASPFFYAVAGGSRPDRDVQSRWEYGGVSEVVDTWDRYRRGRVRYPN